ncbi:hypothetical protein AXG93_3005s1040 [Marchantia polymorpha subsp. ruderalis]|uniref:F-box associated beta-propeller type 1 domain-containing protein n=1 Tax=Marchantia polymorpha subsp. ruderalis TaxID=1480154 RepID=A0A176WLC6_MARPO|nr:hypothetical protein AXG93_3005s1040 [Marchantia polymorpha subsp. ruderalis]
MPSTQCLELPNALIAWLQPLPITSLERLQSRVAWHGMSDSQSVDGALVSPEGLIMTLDTEKSKWLRISLDFFQKPQSVNRHLDRETHSLLDSPLDSLQFVATDGGLLCLSTGTYGHMIVCNLVTKSWKHLWLPPSFGQKERIPENGSRTGRRKHGNMDDFLVGMEASRETGQYKIVVAGLREDADGKRESAIYSSATKSWKMIAASFIDPSLLGPGDQNYGQPVKPRPDPSLTCDGHIYFLLKYEQVHTVGIVWRLLDFDTRNDCWTNVSLPTSIQHQWTWWQVSLQLFEHQGRLVVLESTSWRWYEFYMLLDLKPTWIKILDSLTREVGSFAWLFPSRMGCRTCLRCVGQGQNLYFVEENFDYEPKNLKILECRIPSDCRTNPMSVGLWESHSSDFINQSRCWMYQPSLMPVV